MSSLLSSGLSSGCSGRSARLEGCGRMGIVAAEQGRPRGSRGAARAPLWSARAVSGLPGDEHHAWDLTRHERSGHPGMTCPPNRDLLST